MDLQQGPAAPTFDLQPAEPLVHADATAGAPAGVEEHWCGEEGGVGAGGGAFVEVPFRRQVLQSMSGSQRPSSSPASCLTHYHSMFSLIQVLSGHQSPPLQPGVASPALAADSAGAGQGAASGVVTGKACGTGERGGGYSVLQVLTDKH